MPKSELIAHAALPEKRAKPTNDEYREFKKIHLIKERIVQLFIIILNRFNHF